MIELEQIKKHLNIDDSFLDDDLYLTELSEVAEDAIIKHLNISSLSDITKGGVIPPSVVHAMLLLIGHLYENREPVANSTVVRIPYSYEYLLSLYRQY